MGYLPPAHQVCISASEETVHASQVLPAHPQHRCQEHSRAGNSHPLPQAGTCKLDCSLSMCVSMWCSIQTTMHWRGAHACYTCLRLGVILSLPAGSQEVSLEGQHAGQVAAARQAASFLRLQL